LLHETTRALESAEQDLHASAQIGVARAGFVQIRGALVGGQFERGLEDRFLALLGFVLNLIAVSLAVRNRGEDSITERVQSPQKATRG